MSLDQHIYGSSDWHLPSPSSTPKSVTFPEASLKTPQTRQIPPPHLLDTTSTPLVNGQHTPVQTPSLTFSTPIDWSSSSYSNSVRTPEDPEFHVNHFAPQNLPLPPVQASRRLSSSPDPTQARKVGTSRPSSALGEAHSVNMDFSQMQTPPPTRDSSRRSLQQNTNNHFGTPATVIHRTPNQMPTTEGLFNQTPFGFAATHFSPSMMPFANAGPMTAPAMPQSRLFWDPSTDMTQMEIDMPLASDPFGVTQQNIEQSMNWQTYNPPAANQMNSLAFQSFHGMPPSDPAASFASTSIGGGHDPRSNSFVSTSVGVDPSMLFSFSSPDLTGSFGSMPPQPTLNTNSRQPYETQARDSLRERELAKKARSQHSRTNTNSSSGSIENTKPKLQRSNTENGSKKSRPSSMESRTSSQAAASTIPRRSSPLKRQSGGPLTSTASLTSIPEIRRPRTRLIIDETGRARTETMPAADEQEVHINSRRASQTDVRRQYPGLWEEDDTESEDDPRPVFSRNSSFIIPQPTRRSSSKHARAESGSMERSNSFKMPRPNLKTSSAGFDKSSFETIRPSKISADRIHRRFSMMDLPSSFDNLKAGEDQHMPDSPGDALGALKKVVAGRQQRIERASQNTLKAHNRRWAQASAEQLNATTPHGHSHYDPFSNGFGASPNTDGLTTPSTDRSSLSSESTRCVCSQIDDGQPMIQCESCNKWLHIQCVGLNSNNLPPVFVCIFCTGQTPIARGGRVRGPIPFDSPLTQKSMFRR